MQNDNTGAQNTNAQNVKKLSVLGVILIIFPVVFGFNNAAVAFYRMGYASIIWYVIGAVAFFLPLMFVVAEYAFSFRNSEGGIQTWMNNSKGNFYGFVVTVVFYFAQIFWMVNFSITRIWIPLSCGLVGFDATEKLSFLGLDSTQTIGLLSICFIATITFFATKGFNKVSAVAKVGGIACMAINGILIISAILIAVFKTLKGLPICEEPINGLQTFLVPPNQSVANLISITGFMVYATFAYAGSESVGNLASKTKTERTFSSGIIYSSIFIMIGYSLAIFLWGFVQNSNQMNQNPAINMGNALYCSMIELGFKLGQALGLSHEIGDHLLPELFARITGISMFLITLGAFFAIIYAPLQALLKGAPKGLLPKFLNKKNKANMNQNAMWIQAIIVCSIIAVVSMGGKSSKSFYDLIISMANVSQTCPYFLIFLAFPAFRNNPNLNHQFTILKSKFSVYLASIVGFCVVLIADIINILEPILNKQEGALIKSIFMAAGPVLFSTVAIVVYKNYARKHALK